MDRLTAAKVFIDVVYSGSFTATSQRLNMSRTMVTRHIKSMEDWLKVGLLHRTTRKVSLTTAGSTCLKDVEAWLAEAENLSKLNSVEGDFSGSIRVATSMSFGFTQLMPAIVDFMNIHSKVKVDLDVQENTVDLVKHGIDLAVRIGSAPESNLIGKPIAVCDSVIVASSKYLQTNPEINIPEDLNEHACLGYAHFNINNWYLSPDEEFKNVKIKCRLTANEATSLLYAALHDAGVSLLPAFLVNDYIESGQLERILPDIKLKEMNIYALYSSRIYLSPEVRALIDHLELYFKKHPW